MAKKIKVLLLDGQLLVLELLRLLLESEPIVEVTGSTTSFSMLLEMMDRQRPDVLIADLFDIGMNGFEAASNLRQKFPWVGVLLVSSDMERAHIRRVVKLGIKGLVPKSFGSRELILAVKTLAKGANYMSEEHAKPYHDKHKQLTIREIELVKLVLQGLTNPEIAQNLSISLRTVESHRRKIFHKIQVKNVAELMQYVHSKNILWKF